MRKLFGLYVCLLLTACGGDEGKSGNTAAERTTAVTVTTPEIREVRSVLNALGTVESIQAPTIAAETSGRIIELAASEGDPVKEGQLVVSIDNTLHEIEKAKAKAELGRREAMVENQRREVERLRRLAKTQAVSENQLEDQESRLVAMKGELEVARKQWEQTAYLEEKTRVVSPLDGVLTRRHVSVGDYVAIGQPLFGLVAIDPLQARLAFPEHAASKITTGKTVFLKSPAAPAVEAEGRVTSVNPQVGAANQAVEVIVRFPNPGGWLPGSSVDASLLVESRDEAVTVPRFSVSNRNGRDVVFVVEDQMARAREVTLGWGEGDWVEVRSGLEGDELVVVEGAGLIADGSRVSVAEPRS